MIGVQAQVCHTTPIRTRFMVASHKGDHDFFAKLGHSLQACPGVHAVHSNPLTSSVIVHHDGGQLRAILKSLNRQPTIHVELQAPPPMQPLAKIASRRIQEAIRGFDSSLRELSEGRIDFATVAAAGLTSLALLQMRRGMLLPAGVTLFVMAFRIVNGREIKESNPETAA